MRTQKSSRFALSLKGTGIAVVLLTSALPGFAQKVDDPTVPPPSKLDFSELPPGVEAATIRLLDSGGTALLEVTFDPEDKRVGSGVPILLREKEILLRDDGEKEDAKAGDGVFSAVIDFDVSLLKTQAEFAIKEMSQESAPQPLFRGREMIGVENPEARAKRLSQLVELQQIDRLVASQARINLFNFVPLINPAAISPANSLMITHTRVVQDPTRTINPCTGVGNPNGVWTFKHLVTEMVAGTGIDPAIFVERWLRLWLTPQLVSSGFSAIPRPAMLATIINPWPRLPNGRLDLDRSPFRLSAIVNRVDLAGNSTYGGDAGEGRLIFGVLNRAQGGCSFLPFSVIFEYGVPRSGCEAIKDWANQWVNLSSLPLGSVAYNTALEAITEQFVKAGAAPRKPNGSALNQLRTNENALNFLWELREFKINATSHLLFEDTVKQTPDETLNNTPVFSNYVNTTAIPHTVPDRFPGLAPFMAATARASAAQLNTHFRGPGIVNNNKRHIVSLATCTACHIRETSTNGVPAGNNAFLHVDPRVMPAPLSRFLTGATVSIFDSPDPFFVADPVSGVFRPFNDLDMRRQRLASLAGSSCITRILVPPRNILEVLQPFGPEERVPLLSDPRLNGVNVPILSSH